MAPEDVEEISTNISTSLGKIEAADQLDSVSAAIITLGFDAAAFPVKDLSAGRFFFISEHLLLRSFDAQPLAGDT